MCDFIRVVFVWIDIFALGSQAIYRLRSVVCENEMPTRMLSLYVYSRINTSKCLNQLTLLVVWFTMCLCICQANSKMAAIVLVRVWLAYYTKRHYVCQTLYDLKPTNLRNAWQFNTLNYFCDIQVVFVVKLNNICRDSIKFLIFLSQNIQIKCKNVLNTSGFNWWHNIFI